MSENSGNWKHCTKRKKDKREDSRMENALLELKEKMKLVYAGYGSYLVVLFKFLLALVVFEEINGILPYVEVLDQLVVVLLAALICSIMPWNLMVFCGMGLIVGQCYGVGIEVAGFALALMVIMVILYLRFTPQDALVMLLTPVAFAFVICDQRKFWRDPVLLYGTGFRECFGDDRSGQGREDTESEISCRRADAESGDDDYHHRVCHGSGDCSCGAETGSGICMEYCHPRRRYGIHACYGCRRDFP